MGAREFIAVVLVMFLSALSAIFLVFELHRAAFYLEFLLLLIFGIVSLAVLFGAYFDEMWTWQLSTMLFTALTANFLLLRIAASRPLLSWFGVLISMLGFFVSVASIKSYDSYADTAEPRAGIPVKVSEPARSKQKKRASRK